MDAALAYMDAFFAATGKRLTITHLMARAVAAVLEEVPDANVLLRLGSLYRRKRIGVFFQIAMEDAKTGQADLSGTTIHDPQRKSLSEIFDELDSRFADVRANRDAALARTRSLLSRAPQLLISTLLRLSAFASYSLNLDLSRVGISRDAFGSVMITNVGSLGLEEAYVPLVPYSRVPILLALGAIHESPVVCAGKLAVQQTMKVCVTFDHRALDGVIAAAMAKVLRAWIEDPFAHFERIATPVT